MSDPKGQHEPSMEEILASIRRIIAEDGEAGADEKPGRGEEVLELTEVVEEDGTVVSLTSGPKKAVIEPPAPAPATPPPPPAPKRAAPAPAPEPAFAVEQAAPPRAEPSPPSPARAAPAEAGIVSSAAAAASVSALAQLAAVPQPREQSGSTPLGNTGRTLEDLIRELLTPMLKQWLDANLPALVERLVKDEIQRMSRQAQGR
jgi:cell pole-organizing protein PopZ